MMPDPKWHCRIGRVAMKNKCEFFYWPAWTELCRKKGEQVMKDYRENSMLYAYLSTFAP